MIIIKPETNEFSVSGVGTFTNNENTLILRNSASQTLSITSNKTFEYDSDKGILITFKSLAWASVGMTTYRSLIRFGGILEVRAGRQYSTDQGFIFINNQQVGVIPRRFLHEERQFSVEVVGNKYNINIDGEIYYEGELESPPENQTVNMFVQINASYGDIIFRGDIILEHYIKNKTLILSKDGQYRTYGENGWEVVGTTLTQELIDTHGMLEEDIANIPDDAFESLEEPSFVEWRPKSEDTYDEEDKLSYRILINNDKVIDWVPLTDPPVSFDHDIPNNRFSLGDNIVRVEYKDEFEAVKSWESLVTVINTLPISLITMTPLQVHKEDVRLTIELSDAEGDSIQYRVLVNEVQVHPNAGEYTAPTPSPLNHELIISNNYLTKEKNIVRVEYRDTYDTSKVGEWEGEVTFVNEPPEVSMSLTGLTVDALINEPEGDLVKYKVLLNGVNVYPGESIGFTDFEKAPIRFNKTFFSSDINIGSMNKIEIVAVDEYGGETVREIEFEGAYSGIMFVDQYGDYYSTDRGDILKLLDMGTIVAGQTTPSVPIRLVNKNGYTVKNVRLTTSHNSEGGGVSIQLSEQESPFLPQDILELPVTLGYDDEITFYLRIGTQLSAQPTDSGKFTVYVTADPVM